ncbi:MAG TPA: PPOX class F420-dependent oxidoreductase [Ktedonobacterales bacterium]
MALTPETRAYLSEQRFAVLATINPDGAPQQTVMWYELRGDTVVMNTTKSRLKGRNLARDNRISICVADGYRFLTIAGEARLVDDHAIAQEDIRQLAVRYHGKEKGEAQAVNVFSKQDRISIYVPIEHVITYGFE